jgi:hypothetical protein
MTLILGVVGTASALSFDKTYNKNMWFNSGNVEKTWRFNLDKLKKIDPRGYDKGGTHFFRLCEST